MLRRRRVVLALSLALTALGLGGLAWWWNTRPVHVEVDAPLPPDFPAGGFSHDTFEGLLRKYVRDGRVDYAAWHADSGDRSRLDSYLAALAAYSPDSAPERFGKGHAALSYWLHAYNAFVLKAVLDRWPIDSVTDVRAPVEVVRGIGFFYTLTFTAGGRRYTLYDLEHDKILRPAGDARLHFVLNCASGSCPALRPELPDGPELDAVLDRAARAFVSDPANVWVDHERRVVRLSRLFSWYERDFVSDLERRGLPSSEGVLDYVRSVAGPELLADLERARGFAVEFAEYDWSLNDAGALR